MAVPPPTSTELKARDLLRDLPHREALGERLADRLDRRRQTTTGFLRRAKLFSRLGLANPWDPDARESSLGIGPVGLKLGDRRKPAPHALPKEKAVEAPKPPAPRVPAAPRPAPAEAPAPSPAASRQASPSPTPNRPVSRPTPSRGAEAPAVDRTPPRLVPNPGPSKTTGRVRMAGATQATGPKVQQAPRLKDTYEGPEPTVVNEAGEAQPPEPAPPPEPPRRAAPPDLGLDDLFGFSQNEGRMRMSRRKGGDDAP